MTDSRSSPPSWPTCQFVSNCIGVQLDAHDAACVEHTTDSDARDRWWADVGSGTFDARGLTFTSEQLQQVLDAAPRNEQDSPQLTRADFEKTTFTGHARFDGATFTGDAEFAGATFTGAAIFAEATFTGAAIFAEATFTGAAIFVQATFTGAAMFAEVMFTNAVAFAEATFMGAAMFDAATFTGDAEFAGATFMGAAMFHVATFTGAARFAGATFMGAAMFDAATFTGAALLAPMVVGERISLTEGTFTSRLDLEIATPLVNCTRIRLGAGGHLRVGWAHVDLTDAEIPEPCILEDGADRLHHHGELWNRIDSEELREELRKGLSRTVKLGSLRRATVTGLALGAVDLRDCRFHGAHDLECLRISHTAQLHQAPATRIGRAAAAVLQRLAPGRYRRQVLADEIVCRQAKQARNWQELQVAEVADSATGQAGGLEPIDVAELYRQLRRARESRGDQPGAADFYYGEMEMRRKSPSSSRAERTILFLYWLVSGYALRASRALAFLLVLIALGSVALGSFGYQEPGAQQAVPVSDGGAVQAEVGGWWDAVLTSAESVIFRQPEDAVALTTPGRVTSLVLRAVGPVLLVLAVLSLRGRVKR